MYDFYHRTKVISGAGCVSRVGEECKNRNYKKAVIVTDEFIANCGMLDNMKKSLNDNKIDFTVFNEVKPNPIDLECVRLAEIIKKEDADFIIGFGGGSSLDQAKAAAALVTNGGTCKDWDGKFLNKYMLPVICVPTTAGTGSEVTFVAVITDPVRKFKMSVFDPDKLVPEIAFLDCELTKNLPALMTAYTGVDALTHAIEAYTSKPANDITDAIAFKAMEIILENLEISVNEPENMLAREKMLEASMMAGMAFINSNVGAVHAISETVGAWYGVAHGIANSIFLPHVMKYNISASTEKYAKIARLLGVNDDNISDEDVAYKGVEKILELNERVKIPTLKELGVMKPENFSDISKASATNMLSDDNAKEIDENGYMLVLEEAYKI